MQPSPSPHIGILYVYTKCAVSCLSVCLSSLLYTMHSSSFHRIYTKFRKGAREIRTLSDWRKPSFYTRNDDVTKLFVRQTKSNSIDCSPSRVKSSSYFKAGTPLLLDILQAGAGWISGVSYVYNVLLYNLVHDTLIITYRSGGSRIWIRGVTDSLGRGFGSPPPKYFENVDRSTRHLRHFWVHVQPSFWLR
jgi:hypothetical protein